jgi:hypothetical protein
MHLDQKIDPKETTRRKAAKDLIKLVQKAWELDSLFCPNYVVTLNERENGSLIIRLNYPKHSHGGEETVYTFEFEDDEVAADIQLENDGLFEKYKALIAEDEEDEEAARMWSAAKNNYYHNDEVCDWVKEAVEDAMALVLP